MKKRSLKTIKRELKTARAEAVRTRDFMTCQWCGKKAKSLQDAQPHHIVPQSICNVYGKYDLLNLVTLCFNCHLHRISSYPDEYIVWRNDYLNKKNWIYDELRAYYQVIVKPTKGIYEELLRELQK